MPQSNLKLFRRHDSGCTCSYVKEDRIYKSDTEKRKGKESRKDCTCTIYAEGTLIRADGSKHYLRPKATGERNWDNAETVAERWIAWGGVEPPEPTTIAPNPNQLVKITQAVEDFIAMKNSCSISDARKSDITRFCHHVMRHIRSPRTSHAISRPNSQIGDPMNDKCGIGYLLV